MVLAVYFTASEPAVTNVLLAPWVAALWTIAMAVFGVLLGMFNVWITFPREEVAR